MDNLIKTLPMILQAAGDAPEVVEVACLAAWKHAAGDGLRDHAPPIAMRGTTLLVAVADAMWQKQLQALSGQLLFRLNSLLGQPLVSFVEFRVDPKVVANAAHGPQKSRRDLDPSTISEELLTAAAEIKDKDLRRAFLGAATTCLNKIEKS
jgi:hypothetical protein